MGKYNADARTDAIEMVKEFADTIIEMLIDDGKASDDLFNDYGNGDAYHHETHVDKDYNLTEAAELLNDLRDYEETDSGLWEGLEPRRAIACQAAFTYGNAVYCMWRDYITDINSDFDLDEVVDARPVKTQDEDGEIPEKEIKDAVTNWLKQWITEHE